MKVVFIAGMVHSGSTVLDLSLGCHPRFLGLGEIAGFLDPRFGHLERTDRIVCSCGEALFQCSFWGPFCDELRASPDLDHPERYRKLWHAFARSFGEDRVLVDSSNLLEGVQTWVGLGAEVKVVFLIRDVRAWTVSMRNLSRRMGEYRIRELLRKYDLTNWRPYIRRFATGRFLEWHRGNRLLERYLARSRVPSFQLGYEELAQHPGPMLERICRFLDAEPVDSMQRLDESASHIVLGNRMHADPDRRREIVYDGKWLQQRDWRLPALLLPHVMRYNASRVYRHMPEL